MFMFYCTKLFPRRTKREWGKRKGDFFNKWIISSHYLYLTRSNSPSPVQPHPHSQFLLLFQFTSKQLNSAQLKFKFKFTYNSNSLFTWTLQVDFCWKHTSLLQAHFILEIFVRRTHCTVVSVIDSECW